MRNLKVAKKLIASGISPSIDKWYINVQTENQEKFDQEGKKENWTCLKKADSKMKKKGRIDNFLWGNIKQVQSLMKKD